MAMGSYLGLDSSTQGMKAVVIDPARHRIVGSATVNFGKDLPEFGCPEGVLPDANPLVRHAPPLMWVAALDLVLKRLQEGGVPMGEIQAISGAAQQHGSVYLNSLAEGILANLDPSKRLADQLLPALARATSPIWMDSSTSPECREIDAKVGQRLQLDTGSPAIERFTGPQIRKFFKHHPEAYTYTDRIHLVSSFLCSVLTGKHAPIDFGDGAGMNLLNLKTGDWDDAVLDATAPALRGKLPPARPSVEQAGGLHAYFAKYGLRTGTPVVLWTGDNPSSLVGVGATTPGVAVISLGTSDTFFASMATLKTDPAGYGHVFGNPAGGVMSLICFKNGSLARERVREECGVDWAEFDKTILAQPEPGNNGNLALSYYVPEITPRVMTGGVRRRGSREFCAGQGSVSAKIRATLEGQVCSMRVMSQWIGEFQAIRVTGGASRSRGLVQLIANVFQAKVDLIAVPDSSALGAALRAAHSAAGLSWQELSAEFAAATGTVSPEPGSAPAYRAVIEAYRSFISEVR